MAKVSASGRLAVALVPRVDLYVTAPHARWGGPVRPPECGSAGEAVVAGSLKGRPPPGVGVLFHPTRTWESARSAASRNRVRRSSFGATSVRCARRRRSKRANVPMIGAI